MKKVVFLIFLTLMLAFSLISCRYFISTDDSSKDSTLNTDTDTNTDTSTDSVVDVCEHKNVVIDKAESSTCIKEGLSAGSHCVDCGKIIVEQQVIPTKAHIEVADDDIASTCSQVGYTGGTHCAVCSVRIKEPTEVPKLAHTEIANQDVEPTCSQVGYKGGTHCSACNEEITKATVVPKKPHIEKTLIGYASTCKREGLTDGKQCTVCDTITEKQYVLDKLSHTEEITSKIEPTCQRVGYTEKRQCTVCKEITLKSVEIPKSDHTKVIDKAVSATCSTSGLTEGSHCSICNIVLVKQEKIPSNGNHVYEEFAKVTTMPSYSSGSSGTISCTKCGKSENVTFEKLSSSKLTKDDIYSVETDKYNPAYDNRWKIFDGKTTVSSIYVAGDWFGNVGDVLVITLNQEMSITNLKIYTAGNYTTAEIRIKDSAGNTTYKGGILAHGAANGGTAQTHTLVSNGNIKAYTIEIEIKSLKWDDAKTLKISEVEITGAKYDTRLPHTHSYRKYIENERVATCQEVGLDVYECFCSNRKAIETKKGEHNFNSLKSVKKVSCTEDGFAIYECFCGETKTSKIKATGHTYYKLIEYITQPTVSSEGRASFKCNDCSLVEEKAITPLPLQEINYLRVDKIENGKVVLKLNIYGDKPEYEVRFSTSEITEDNYSDATVINATIDGSRLITITLSLDASLKKGYYVAVRPYMGSNYGKVATVRVGGDIEIPIDYSNAQVYHGEVLNSFYKMFDDDITTQLGTVFANSGDTVELFGSKLSPIVDIEYNHYVTKIKLYYNAEGKSVTVRWSDTPIDFQADNSKWDGYKTIVSKKGWNDIEVNLSTRYFQIIYTDGEAPCEVEAYGYQCGEGDEIATERGTLPTIGEMLGMCGFVAGGGGNTPIDSVICVGVLREYHNFGWSYSAKSYGTKDASFFRGTTNWMGDFESQYRKYKEAGLNVIPCIQWNIGKGETISYKVNSDNLPVYSNNELVRATFWERFNPHTYFVYADSMFAFSARFGSNKSSTLLEIAKLHCLDTPAVGLGTLKWIEMGNEPEGNWNGIHNYLSAYQLAAATSASYDGHCRTLKSPVTGGYHLGGKNADPNMKFAMAGVSGVSNEYIMALCYWQKANRNDGKTAFDAFNVHHYMTKQIQLPNGSTTYVGISPEEANIGVVLSQLIGIRDKYYPEKEVWITEFGWDTNQSYATSTSSHAYGEYTGREVQAMWLTRTYLILSAVGIDKADMYMCEDTGVEEISVGKYGTSGVIGYEYDENGKTVEVKKDSYYYLYTLKNALGGYTFDSQVEAYDENVMIYKYKTADGKTAYAVWCKTSDGTKADNYQLGINSDSATLVEAVYGDIDGEQSRLVADEYGYISIDVSEKPIYILVN